ncbi:GNAT family N-acetyltransferase [Nonomuraea sp. NPDC052265]|uniref:GNAT family N-acetyltransferase n=1 Tax=Nonomuraea sp. NPDC052265 TaxID=3364374 RepID=UPI0037CA2D45
MAHDEIIDHYSALARAADAGRITAGCGQDVFEQGYFGAAGYDGGGTDVLRSARRVGAQGGVYGLDAGVDMLARRNAEQAGAADVEFLHGSIERVPLPVRSVDVVISNCAINLSGDKGAVSAEVTMTAEHGDGVHSAIVQAAKPAAPPQVEIRPMRTGDADQVLAIYQAGLDTGQASFETLAPSWEDFTAARLPGLRYVACDTGTGQVLGWVAASAVSSRCVYAGVVEHSIYVHPGCRARGIGRALLAAFIAAAEDAGVWTIQSGIFPENAASLALHQTLGFRVVGTRERVGCHHGLWRDVLMIERRSTLTGT